MADTTPLAIDLIQVLGTVQPRQTLNEDAIADYAALYAPDSKHTLPPLRVFQDGDRYILSRGFHRYTAAQRAKRGSLPCEVIKGTERDAILDAMQDNAEHGVRLTPADKRKAVNRLLDDPEWGKLTQAKVAELANGSPRFVQMLVAERKPKSPPENNMRTCASGPEEGEKTIGKDGKERPKTKPGVKGGIAAAVNPEPVPEPESPDPAPKATGKGKPKTGGAGIVALDGAEAEAFDARQQVKCWADTVGRWLSQLPSIDGYRKTYPGPKGDKVVKAATELYKLLKEWEKVIK